MSTDTLSEKTAAVLVDLSINSPQTTAAALRALWLKFEPNKGVGLIKAEEREALAAAGTPIPVLQTIGKEMARQARKKGALFLPLAQILWDEYGREGRVVALIVFGALELEDPQNMVPLLKKNCRGCISWEDADRLAMDAVEPIVRKFPERWLGEMAAWLKDDNKWVRRAAVTIIGRLTMKYPDYTAQCLELAGQLLQDNEEEVKKAVSFAIRICAKANPGITCAFVQRQIPPADPAATWVLCDVIRSLDRKLIPDFALLLERYQEWGADPAVTSKDRRSIESAVKVLAG